MSWFCQTTEISGWPIRLFAECIGHRPKTVNSWFSYTNICMFSWYVYILNETAASVERNEAAASVGRLLDGQNPVLWLRALMASKWGRVVYLVA